MQYRKYPDVFLVVVAAPRSRDEFHWNFLRPGKVDVSCFSHLTDAGQQENTLTVWGLCSNQNGGNIQCIDSLKAVERNIPTGTTEIDEHRIKYCKVRGVHKR